MNSEIREKKILIIDDDPQMIFMLRHVLDKKGYSVESATSGGEGLQIIKSFSADLILLDILMPVMDGYEVCNQLKGNPETSYIPVIFITASHDPEELIRGFDSGAVDFISKPLNKSELLARVNTHIELKHSRDTIYQRNKELYKEIEKRKQTEEKFKALSEMAFEAVLFLDKGKIVEANKAAIELFDLESYGRKDVRLDDLFNAAITATLMEICKTNGEIPREILLSRKDGKEFYGLVHHRKLNYMKQAVDVLAVKDITRQKEIDKEIFNAILETEEKERKRFSRDMHDGLGALLSTLKIYLNLLQKENKSFVEKQALLDEMKETINQAIATARTIANNIMPSLLMDYGLIKALEVFAESLGKTGAIQMDFEYTDNIEIKDDKTQTHIYRIALELINNTLKHANATRSRLSLSISGNKLLMDYTDNGIGFNFDGKFEKSNGSQGLKNIMSRISFLNGKGNFEKLNTQGIRFTMEVPV
jgi:PAS domain S-box-containing protein